MNFGQAIEALKNGKCVARAGWNGKGMWLDLVPGQPSSVGEFHEHLPFIQMKTVADQLVPWLASQTDMLAEDWEIVS